MPPLPGTSWVPKMAFSLSSTYHLPPDLFLLVRLWPVSALTFQPSSDLPSKIETKPSSLSLGLSLSSRAAEERGASRTARAASTAANVRRRRNIGESLQVVR